MAAEGVTIRVADTAQEASAAVAAAITRVVDTTQEVTVEDIQEEEEASTEDITLEAEVASAVECNRRLSCCS